MSQRHFQKDLEQLNTALVRMAGLAESAVKSAVEALNTRSLVKARAVVEADNAIDALEVEIDALAVDLLALQQPMARDLRLITIAMKISSDLERVGDHAVNIAETVEYIAKGPGFPRLPGLDEMARIATEMLAKSLDAFVRTDATLAREVVRMDDLVDELHGANFRVLLTHIAEDPRRIGAGMDLLLVSGNLERIADLATNVSENVVFLVEGRSIKHRPRSEKVGGDAAPEGSPAAS